MNTTTGIGNVVVTYLRRTPPEQGKCHGVSALRGEKWKSATPRGQPARLLTRRDTAGARARRRAAARDEGCGRAGPSGVHGPGGRRRRVRSIRPVAYEGIRGR